MNSREANRSRNANRCRCSSSFRAKTSILRILTGLGIISQGLQGADFTWTGASGNNWLTPANWSPNGIPGADDRARLNTGLVNINGPVTVKELQMLGANVRVNGPLLVLSSLQWSCGNLWLEQGTLIVNQGFLDLVEID